jgi:hypothetical protein
MNTKLTKEDTLQIESMGAKVQDVLAQFSHFEKGFPYMKILKPATLHNGILWVDIKEIQTKISEYEQQIAGKKIVKFVPASGAASRMFKDLFSLLNTENKYVTQKSILFLQQLPQYAFYDDLKKAMKSKGYFLEKEIEEKNYKTVISFLLDECGLNYKNLPKALLKFHHYAENDRIALEEHLVEAALYAKNSDEICYVHFTLSPAHIDLFLHYVEKIQPCYEKRFGIKYDITYSVQDPATDTLASTLDNQPCRDEHGKLLFRPAGHGALIHNVNRLDADIIFIKNIDNVITENKLADTILYKKLLALILLKVEKQLHTYLSEFEDCISLEKKREIISFMNHTFSLNLKDDITEETLRKLLDRPLLVCGMVKNEGEPGGGPFFVKDDENGITLQIVETSQMDMQDPYTQKCLQEATHFNPVDLVCSIKNYKGEKMNLTAFIDPETGFISEKSSHGKTLKAMELPGLWNGAMAKWNTLFVEVPLSTFNPVKTVFDLGNVKRNNENSHGI